MIRWPAERAVCSVRQSARWQHRYSSHSCHEKMYNVRTCVRILSTLLIIILIGKCFLPPVSDDVSVPSRKTVKTEELLLLLAELAVLPPEAPVNQTCRPAELRDWMSPLTLTDWCTWPPSSSIILLMLKRKKLDFGFHGLNTCLSY